MKLLIILSAMTAALQAAALDISSTAGKLREAVNGATAAATLKVSGSVNAADIMFIQSEMMSLTSLDLSGAAIEEYNGEPLLNSVAHSPAGSIPPAAFLGMKLASFSFPSNTTSIGDGAFGATALTAVEVPAGVTAMGSSAFADCQALASASLPATVTRIGTGTFRGCGNLASVTIDSPIREIPALTFAGCAALRNIDIPRSVRIIGERAFADSGLAAAELNDIDSIAPWAFAGCRALASVTFSGTTPDAIGQGAFFRDSNAEVRLGGLMESLSEIQPHSFTGVKAVSGLGTPAASSVGKVGEYAMAYTSPGTTVYLPAELREIGEAAFANWRGVREIDVTDLPDLPEIGPGIFGDIDKPNTILYVAAEMIPAFSDAEQWKEFDIRARTSGETGVDMPATPAAAEVKAWFEGTLIHLASTAAITSVELYDLAGLRLAVVPAAGTLSITLDTAPFPGRAYIARVNHGPSAATLLKLAR